MSQPLTMSAQSKRGRLEGVECFGAFGPVAVYGPEQNGA